MFQATEPETTHEGRWVAALLVIGLITMLAPTNASAWIFDDRCAPKPTEGNLDEFKAPNALIMLDRSGSMSQQGGGGMTRWQAAKKAIDEVGKEMVRSGTCSSSNFRGCDKMRLGLGLFWHGDYTQPCTKKYKYYYKVKERRRVRERYKKYEDVHAVSKSHSFSSTGEAHTFNFKNFPTGYSDKIRVKVELWGEYGSSSRYADVFVDGNQKGTVQGGSNCNSTAHAKTFEMGSAPTADGTINVKVDNSGSVGVSCGTNKAKVTVSFWKTKSQRYKSYYKGHSQKKIHKLTQKGENALLKFDRIKADYFDLHKGLVGHWTLDGDAKDRTANGHDGSVSGATVTKDRFDQAGGAYAFDGSDTISASSPAAPHNSDKITVSAWVKSADNTGMIVGKGDSYFLWFDGGNLRWEIRSNNRWWDAAGEGNKDVLGQNDDLWHHVVGTYDGSTFKTYVDGNLMRSYSKSGLRIDDNNNSLDIGHATGWSRSLKGNIDDVRVYDRALSATEISRLYQKTNIVKAEVELTGDYGNSNEYADVFIDGVKIGRHQGAGSDCSSATKTFDASATHVADGIADLRVKNSGAVQPVCGTNKIRITLSFWEKDRQKYKENYKVWKTKRYRKRYKKKYTVQSETKSKKLQKSGENWVLNFDQYDSVGGNRLKAKVTLWGDYDASNEYAKVYIDGNYVGKHQGPNTCKTGSTKTFTVNSNVLDDGKVDVRVDNTSYVGKTCGTGRMAFEDFEGSDPGWFRYYSDQSHKTRWSGRYPNVNDDHHRQYAGSEAGYAGKHRGLCGYGGLAKSYSFNAQPEKITMKLRTSIDYWGRANVILKDSNGHHILWTYTGTGFGWRTKTFDISKYDKDFTIIIGNADMSSRWCGMWDHGWNIWVDNLEIRGQKTGGTHKVETELQYWQKDQKKYKKYYYAWVDKRYKKQYKKDIWEHSEEKTVSFNSRGDNEKVQFNHYYKNDYGDVCNTGTVNVSEREYDSGYDHDGPTMRYSFSGLNKNPTGNTIKVKVRLKGDYNSSSEEARVYVDGHYQGDASGRGQCGSWNTTTFNVPASYVSDGRLNVRLDNRRAVDYCRSYGYVYVQYEGSTGSCSGGTQQVSKSKSKSSYRDGKNFDYYFRNLPKNASGDINVKVHLRGDYDYYREEAKVYVDGNYYGEHDGRGQCGSWDTKTFKIPASAVSDGTLKVELNNTYYVDYCRTDSKVEIDYTASGGGGGGGTYSKKKTTKFYRDGEANYFTFNNLPKASGNVKLKVKVYGDFGYGSEKAKVYGDGHYEGYVGGRGRGDCRNGGYSKTFSIPTSRINDGKFRVKVDNHRYVDLFCSRDEHHVTLTYDKADSDLGEKIKFRVRLYGGDYNSSSEYADVYVDGKYAGRHQGPSSACSGYKDKTFITNGRHIRDGKVNVELKNSSAVNMCGNTKADVKMAFWEKKKKKYKKYYYVTKTKRWKERYKKYWDVSSETKTHNFRRRSESHTFTFNNYEKVRGNYVDVKVELWGDYNGGAGSEDARIWIDGNYQGRHPGPRRQCGGPEARTYRVPASWMNDGTLKVKVDNDRWVHTFCYRDRARVTLTFWQKKRKKYKKYYYTWETKRYKKKYKNHYTTHSEKKSVRFTKTGEAKSVTFDQYDPNSYGATTSSSSSGTAGTESDSNSVTFTSAAQTKTIHFDGLDPNAATKVKVDLKLVGDYSTSSEYAKIYIDGNYEGTHQGPSTDCNADTQTFYAPASAVSDSKLEVKVVNSSSVGVFCNTNEAKADISYTKEGADSTTTTAEKIRTKITLYGGDYDASNEYADIYVDGNYVGRHQGPSTACTGSKAQEFVVDGTKINDQQLNVKVDNSSSVSPCGQRKADIEVSYWKKTTKKYKKYYYVSQTKRVRERYKKDSDTHSQTQREGFDHRGDAKTLVFDQYRSNNFGQSSTQNGSAETGQQITRTATRKYDAKPFKASCADIDGPSGTYTIDPDGPDGKQPFPVYCKMSANGGKLDKLTRLFTTEDGAKSGDKGWAFGENGTRWESSSEMNFGRGDGAIDSYLGEFSRSEAINNPRTWAIGDAFMSTYKGKQTEWDYYDADGNPIHPDQIEALAKTSKGTYYDGGWYVDDIDHPIPDRFAVKHPNNYDCRYGGCMTIFPSYGPDPDKGADYVLGSNRNSGYSRVDNISWRKVHDTGIPTHIGFRDGNGRIADWQEGDFSADGGHTLEFENPYFWVDTSGSTIDLAGAAADAELIFKDLPKSGSKVDVKVTLSGDYGASSEYAKIYVDGNYVGLHDGPSDCGSNTQTYQVAASEVSDGTLKVEVRNSSLVGTHCDTNQAKADIEYHRPDLPKEQTTTSEKIKVAVKLKGDYNGGSEYARVYVDGNYVGRHNGSGANCSNSGTKTFVVDGKHIQDGKLNVKVDNNGNVHMCGGSDTNWAETTVSFWEKVDKKYPKKYYTYKNIQYQKQYKSKAGKCNRSCADIDGPSGTYTIDPDGPGGRQGFPVYCKMSANSGKLKNLTRLFTTEDGAKHGDKGWAFGENDTRWESKGEMNLGYGSGNIERGKTLGEFSKSGARNNPRTWAIGDSFMSTYKGKSTEWDYYDADGNPIHPDQIEALAKISKGTYYDGGWFVDDIDRPINDIFAVSQPNNYNCRYGGCLTIFPSHGPDPYTGADYVLGSYRGSGYSRVDNINWRKVHDSGIPTHLGFRDGNGRIANWREGDFSANGGSTLEFENPYFWVATSSSSACGSTVHSDAKEEQFRSTGQDATVTFNKYATNSFGGSSTSSGSTSSGGTVSESLTKSFSTSGQNMYLRFQDMHTKTKGDVKVDVTLTGDFGDSNENATVYIDGNKVGTHQGGSDCNSGTQTFTVGGSVVSDGRVTVRVDLSSDVSTFCKTNEAKAKVYYDKPDLPGKEVTVSEKIRVNVDLWGDYGGGNEYADIYVEGNKVGRHQGPADCGGPSTKTFTVDGKHIQDGKLDVKIANSGSVNTTCHQRSGAYDKAKVTLEFWTKKRTKYKKFYSVYKTKRYRKKYKDYTKTHEESKREQWSSRGEAKTFTFDQYRTNNFGGSSTSTGTTKKGDTITRSRTLHFLNPGQDQQFSFGGLQKSSSNVKVDVALTGDYGSSDEKADIYVDGNKVGTHQGPSTDCNTDTQSFSVPASYVNDGNLNVEVKNSKAGGKKKVLDFDGSNYRDFRSKMTREYEYGIMWDNQGSYFRWAESSSDGRFKYSKKLPAGTTKLTGNVKFYGDSYERSGMAFYAEDVNGKQYMVICDAQISGLGVSCNTERGKYFWMNKKFTVTSSAPLEKFYVVSDMENDLRTWKDEGRLYDLEVTAHFSGDSVEVSCPENKAKVDVSYTGTSKTGTVTTSEHIKVNVELKGDYASGNEYANVYVDGNYVGRHQGPGDCSGTKTETFTVPGKYVRDGALDVKVDNSGYVGICGGGNDWADVGIGFWEKKDDKYPKKYYKYVNAKYEKQNKKDWDGSTGKGSWTDGFEDNRANDDGWRELNYDWHDSGRGWKSSRSAAITDGYVRGGYSFGRVQAEIHPSEISGGKEAELFRYYYWETSSSNGGGIRLRDSSNREILAVGTGNPQWRIWAQSDHHIGGNYYRDWIRVTVKFDWPNKKAWVEFKNMQRGTTKSKWVQFEDSNAQNLEEIEVINTSDDMYMWFDDFEVQVPAVNDLNEKTEYFSSAGEDATIHFNHFKSNNYGATSTSSGSTSSGGTETDSLTKQFTKSGENVYLRYDDLYTKTKGDVDVKVTLTGDYGSSDEFAKVWIDGNYVGKHQGGSDCNAGSKTFTVSGSAVSDGKLEVRVDNSSDVSTFCGTNEITGDISYQKPDLPGSTTETYEMIRAKVTLSGDYGAGNEYAKIYADGNYVGTHQGPGGCGKESTKTFNFPGKYIQDGKLAIKVENTGYVSNNCGGDKATVDVEFWQKNKKKYKKFYTVSKRKRYRERYKKNYEIFSESKTEEFTKRGQNTHIKFDRFRGTTGNIIKVKVGLWGDFGAGHEYARVWVDGNYQGSHAGPSDCQGPDWKTWEVSDSYVNDGKLDIRIDNQYSVQLCDNDPNKVEVKLEYWQKDRKRYKEYYWTTETKRYKKSYKNPYTPKGRWHDGFEDCDVDDDGWNERFYDWRCSGRDYGGTYSAYVYDYSVPGTIAEIHPSAMQGGVQADWFRFYYYEYSNSNGGGVTLRDSSNREIMTVGTNNPQWHVWGSRHHDLGGWRYYDWHRVTVKFDWPNNRAEVEFRNQSTGRTRSDWVNFKDSSASDLEEIEVVKIGGNNMVMWFDDFEVRWPGAHSYSQTKKITGDGQNFNFKFDQFYPSSFTGNRVKAKVELWGDYGAGSENARVWVDGNYQGRIRGSGGDCNNSPHTKTWDLDSKIANDETINVRVQNSSAVNDFCSPRQVKVTLSFWKKYRKRYKKYYWTYETKRYKKKYKKTYTVDHETQTQSFHDGENLYFDFDQYTGVNGNRIKVEVSTRGDYNSGSEDARVWIDGNYQGHHNGGGQCDYSWSTRTYWVSDNYLNDGELRVRVDNDRYVNDFCTYNQVRVKITFYKKEKHSYRQRYYTCWNKSYRCKKKYYYNHTHTSRYRCRKRNCYRYRYCYNHTHWGWWGTYNHRHCYYRTRCNYYWSWCTRTYNHRHSSYRWTTCTKRVCGYKYRTRYRTHYHKRDATKWKWDWKWATKQVRVKKWKWAYKWAWTAEDMQKYKWDWKWATKQVRVKKWRWKWKTLWEKRKAQKYDYDWRWATKNVQVRKWKWAWKTSWKKLNPPAMWRWNTEQGTKQVKQQRWKWGHSISWKKRYLDKWKWAYKWATKRVKVRKWKWAYKTDWNKSKLDKWKWATKWATKKVKRLKWKWSHNITWNKKTLKRWSWAYRWATKNVPVRKWKWATKTSWSKENVSKYKWDWKWATKQVKVRKWKWVYKTVWNRKDAQKYKWNTRWRTKTYKVKKWKWATKKVWDARKLKKWVWAWKWATRKVKVRKWKWKYKDVWSRKDATKWKWARKWATKRVRVEKWRWAYKANWNKRDGMLWKWANRTVWNSRKVRKWNWATRYVTKLVEVEKWKWKTKQTTCTTTGDHSIVYNGVQEDNHSSIMNTLNNNSPKGSAPPLADAVTTMRNDSALQKTNRKGVGILVTDGKPKKGQAVKAVQEVCKLANRSSSPAKTYVVGFSKGANTAYLDLLAAAGDTGSCCPTGQPNCGNNQLVDPCGLSSSQLSNYVSLALNSPASGLACEGSYEADHPTQVKQALLQIAEDISCSFEMKFPGAGAYNPDRAYKDPKSVTVRMKHKQFGWIDVPHYSSGTLDDELRSKGASPATASQYANQGWEFKSGSNRTKITLTSKLCGEIMSGKTEKVQTQVACDCPNTGKSCTVKGRSGACAAGQYTCDVSAGGVEKCTPVYKIGQEIPGSSCTVKGKVGRCAAGVKVCASNGDTVCKSVHRPMPEICNGRDDDCDGKTDNIRESWNKSWNLKLPGKVDSDYAGRACGGTAACSCNGPGQGADSSNRGTGSSKREEWKSMLKETYNGGQETTSCYCME